MGHGMAKVSESWNFLSGGQKCLEGGAAVDGHLVVAVVVGEELREVVGGDDCLGLPHSTGHQGRGQEEGCYHRGEPAATDAPA